MQIIPPIPSPVKLHLLHSFSELMLPRSQNVYQWPNLMTLSVVHHLPPVKPNA